MTNFAVAIGPASAVADARRAFASARSEWEKSRSDGASGAPASVATIHAAAKPRQAALSTFAGSPFR